MRIKDIKNKEIRELAIKNCDDGNDDVCDGNTDLEFAFTWRYTKEGGLFWNDVNEGRNPTIKQSRIELLEQTLREVKSQLFDVNKRETVLTLGIQSVLDQK